MSLDRVERRSPVQSRLATGGSRRSGDRKTQMQRTSVGVGLLAAIVGFLLVTQATSVKNVDDELASLPPAEIGRIVSNLSAEKDRLRDEVTRIEGALSDSRSVGRRNSTLASEAARARNDQSVAAGSSTHQGPGIKLRIDDPNGSLRALDIADLVRELYASGAERVTFGNAPATTLSAYEDADGVIIDGTPVAQPYHVSALGDPELMEQTMTMPGGYLGATVGLDGVVVKVDIAKELQVPSANPRVFKYARPIPEKGNTSSQP